MSKKIKFDEKNRELFLNAIDKTAKAVGSTLGPKGRFVAIDKGANPVFSKDGWTVLNSIDFDDPVENLALKLLRNVATKTNNDVGDGSTTFTVLANSILKEGIKSIKAGYNPVEIKKGIDKATKIAIDVIDKTSKPISTNDEILQVASISANNDKEIGNLVLDAVNHAGKDGVISIEESKDVNSSIKVVEGLQIDRGYLSPYFVKEKDSDEVVLENALILICDKKISSIKEIIPILEQVAQANKPLLVIADDIDGEAMAALIINNARGALNVVAIKAPAFGDKRKEMLDDIAVLTGGVFVSEELGYSLEKTTIDMLGKASTIKVSKNNTTIINGNGDKEAIRKRVDDLKALTDKAENKYDKEKYRERLAKLTNGIVVIKVGAFTELELKEKKYRVEDALSATKSAVDEGIVPGGSSALILASKTIAESDVEGCSDGERVGMNIMISALQYPLRKIAENAGFDPSVIVGKVAEEISEDRSSYGFNAENGIFGNMFEQGIVDSAKVAKETLKNSASISGMMLMTECSVAEKPNKNPPMPMGMPMMG